MKVKIMDINMSLGDHTILFFRHNDKPNSFVVAPVIGTPCTCYYVFCREVNFDLVLEHFENTYYEMLASVDPKYSSCARNFRFKVVERFGEGCLSFLFYVDLPEVKFR